MDKKLIIGLVVVLLVGAIFLTLWQSGTITGATVAGQKKCLNAKAALKFINDKGCTRIYEDQGCTDKGFVEVQC